MICHLENREIYPDIVLLQKIQMITQENITNLSHQKSKYPKVLN